MSEKTKTKILIINDLRIELRIYASLFLAEGYEVLQATSASEGLICAGKEKPACILVDNIMPEMNGTEFSRKIKSDPQIKDIPVILLTATDSPDSLIHALHSGANDYILKSSDHKLLVEKVKSWINWFEIQNEFVLLTKNKEDFLSIVSHDLKSPIAFIEASMGLVLESYKNVLPKEALDFIERSQRRSRYALDLIHDILESGRTEYDRPHFELHSLKDLLYSCFENYGLKIKEKKIEFKHNIQAVDKNVYTDKSKFLQVVNNILGNAIKFVPEGSQISLTVHLLPEIKSFRLEIADNGAGIPSEKLESIFEKYNRGNLKGTQSGTGLGLSICRQICNMLGGNIWAENNVGGGAVFKILLPGLMENQETVLICDDSLTVRNYLAAILEKAGYSTISAESGEKAVELILEQAPSLIVMDMIMPGMNGIETVKAIRKIPGREKIPVIFQTSFKSEQILDELTQVGQDFIMKPVGEKEFLKKVEHFFVQDPKKYDRRILLLTSDQDFQQLANEIFEKNGWACVQAKNSYEAKFFTKTLRFNIVLADVRNANTENAEFAQHIQQARSETLLYLVTDGSLSEHFFKELGLGNFIQAPVDEAKLNILLRKEHQERQQLLKILLVEDSEDGALLIQAMLRNSPVSVTCVSNGIEAIKEFQKEKFDLIFMDIEMPVLNGLEATAKIRAWEQDQKRERTPIYALTAHSQGKEILASVDAGCDAHISKPIKKDELLALIRKIG